MTLSPYQCNAVYAYPILYALTAARIHRQLITEQYSLAIIVVFAICVQVQDGYFVKHTSSARESASYLTLVSRRLSQMYSRTSVRSCTRDELSRRPLLANGITHHTRLLQFNDFNELAIKNKVMSVTELFARQLMQLTGISAARASSVLELYPTPRLLMEAYDNAGSESEKLGLLSNVTAGSAKRRFNSAPLYHMYAVRDTAS